MKEQFVPYELALKLKELGFNETCLAWYVSTIELQYIFNFNSADGMKNDISAPLWQQAFDWFRKEKGLKGSYDVTCFKTDFSIESYGYNLTDLYGKNKHVAFERSLKTYQEARLKCLEKLIEVVETKKDSV